MLTRKEVSQKLGVSTTMVDNLIKDGSIKAYKIGKRVRIPKEAVDDFLEESLIKPMVNQVRVLSKIVI